jgi:hypothetical protein
MEGFASAKELFERAKEKYIEGDLNSSLRLLEESYDLSHLPELLFNLGELNDELHRCAPALDDYQRYLERMPSGAKRAEAEEAVARLSAKCPASASAATLSIRSSAPVAAEPAAPYWSTAHAVGWSAIAGAVVAEVGALYFSYSAKNAADDVDSIASMTVKMTPSMRMAWDSTGESRQSAGEQDQAWALTLGLGGAALAAGGLVLLVISSGKQEPKPAASLTLEPRKLGAAYSFAF